MELLRRWFETNQVVVFAVYGQIFFTLGVALAVQSMKRTRLIIGKHLHWLAAFGLSHGLVEWGYVFIPIQETYLSANIVEGLRWLQLGLMVFSFAALLRFGLRTSLRDGPLTQVVEIVALVGMTVTVIAALSNEGGETSAVQRTGIEIWSRYLLAVTGATASAAGIFRARAEARTMQAPRIARWLKISAWSLLGYAVLNLITPQHHWALARLSNYDEVLQLLGVPAQILRTLVGSGILYGMVRGLALFEIETDRLFHEAQQAKVLEAQRELSYMNKIAITLGKARDPGIAMRSVLQQFLPFLRCTGGAIVMVDTERTGDWPIEVRVGQFPALTEPSEATIARFAKEVASKDRVITHEFGPECFGTECVNDFETVRLVS